MRPHLLSPLLQGLAEAAGKRRSAVLELQGILVSSPVPRRGGVTPGHRAGTRMPSSPAAAVLRGAASGLSWPAPGGPSAWMWPPQHLGGVGGFLGCHEEGEQEAQRAAKQPEGQGQAAGVHPAAATPGGGCLCTLTAHPRPPAAGP